MNTPPAHGACFHCSEPLPRDHPHAYDAMLGDQVRSFCCPACRTVAETIHGMGLDAYYRQRDSKPRQRAASALQWQDMDLPAVSATFVRTTGPGLAEADLLVPDIHCASCCWLIEHRLQQLPGVRAVRAGLEQQKVHVEWDTSAIRPSALFEALASVGYRAMPWQDSTRQQAAEAQQAMLLRRTGVAGLVAMQIHMIAMGNYFGADITQGIDWEQLMNTFALLLSLPVWFYAATPFYASAWRHLRSGTLGMDLPVVIAIVTAAIASVQALWQHSSDVYFDSIAMFVFLLLGARYLESRARQRLTQHAQPPPIPQTCLRWRGDTTEQVSVLQLQPGDIILAGPGERLAVDGIVVEGEAAVEEALLTGESLPVHRARGDYVLAGTTLQSGSLRVQAQHWGADARLGKLHERMEQALQVRQGRFLHDRLAQWFTPVILVVACASALYWALYEPARALPALLAVLVASCPCALSIAIPAARTAATLQLRKQGILVTSEHVLLLLPSIRCWVFDKTGTLTTGRFGIEHTDALSSQDAQSCTAIAAALEAHSHHPLAQAFAGRQGDEHAQDVQVLPHCGITGWVNGRHYRLGSPAWLGQAPSATDTGVQVVLANDNGPVARWTLDDSVRPDAAALVQSLRREGAHCVILSGDASSHVESVARTVAVADVHQGCSPEEKVQQLQRLRQQYGAVAMAGDGINDGPVLATADVSISLAEASQTARLAADVLLLNNRLGDLSLLLAVARHTRRVARQNVTWAFGYNLVILPLAAAGQLPPAVAAAGMALSSLLVTLNALRLFRHPPRDA